MTIEKEDNLRIPSAAEAEEDGDYIVIPDYLFVARSETNPHLQELSVLAQSLDGSIRPAADAFLHNMNSLYQLAELPWSLISAGNFNAWSLANVFLDLGKTFPGMRAKKSEFIEMAAKARARAEQNIDGPASLVRSDLEMLAANSSFVSSAWELINQGLVLAWGSFEVIVGDSVCSVLNARPKLAVRVISDSTAKRHFAVDKLSVELLSEFNFDLSASMGTFATRNLNLSSIGTIKVLAEALFGNADLRDVLDSRVLYYLSERRHLIVHRRGVVDAKYVGNVGDGRVEGERLKVKSQELEEAIIQVSLCGLRLLCACQKILSEAERVPAT